MTCEEALRLLYDVIDKESSQIDSEKVKEHLNGCRHCMARYEFETMFKTFVVDKAASKTKSDQLRNKILSRLEEAERNPETISSRPARNKYRLFFLSAAALIVFVVAALSVAQMYRHQTFVYPFEKNHLDDHMRCDDVRLCGKSLPIGFRICQQAGRGRIVERSLLSLAKSANPKWRFGGIAQQPGGGPGKLEPFAGSRAGIPAGHETRSRQRQYQIQLRSLPKESGQRKREGEK